MRRFERRKHVNHERWLVSYADFITLLFAFFVVLYASSKADQAKQVQIAHSIQSAFSALGLFPQPLSDNHTAHPGDPHDPVAPVNVMIGDDLAASPEVQKDLQRLQSQLAAS